LSSNPQVPNNTRS